MSDEAVQQKPHSMLVSSCRQTIPLLCLLIEFLTLKRFFVCVFHLPIWSLSNPCGAAQQLEGHWQAKRYMPKIELNFFFVANAFAHLFGCGTSRVATGRNPIRFSVLSVILHVQPIIFPRRNQTKATDPKFIPTLGLSSAAAKLP